MDPSASDPPNLQSQTSRNDSTPCASYGQIRKRDNSAQGRKELVKIQETELSIPRTIGLLGGVSFIVGTIIGSGIFISPRGVASNAGSVGMTLIVWFLCGVISLLGAFCYSELATVVKCSGADYSYLHEAYGSLMSFQFSWINNLVIKPGSQATLALTFAEYIVTPLFGVDCGRPPELIKKLLAVVLLLFLGGVNMFSVKGASRVQIIFTFTKLAAVLLIIGGGVYNLTQGFTENFRSAFTGTNLYAGSIMTSFYSGMFAYDGWNTANFIVEEMINFERNLPLAIVLGVPSVVIMYVMMNVSYFTVLNINQMVESPAVALTWAEAVIPKVAWIISTFVALSCFGACNGSLFSGGRLMNVAARKNHLPGVLSMVHVESFTPIMAIICNVSIAIIITFVGTISSLIDSLSFVMLLFNCFNFAGVIILRYRNKYKNVPRPVKVPLIVPFVCFLSTACLVIIPLVVSPQIGYFFALGFILIGYIFYVPFVHFNLKPPFMDKLTECTQLLFQVFMPQ